MFFGGPANMIFTNSDNLPSIPLKEKDKGKSNKKEINTKKDKEKEKEKRLKQSPRKEKEKEKEKQIRRYSREVIEDPNDDENPNSSEINTISTIKNEKLEEELKKLELQQLEEERKYKSQIIRKTEDEHILCLCADGSETSKQAYEIIISEFLPRIKNSILMCTYIYNSLKDEKFNWRYQKQHVFEYYKTRLTTSLPEDIGYLIIQDKDNYYNHEIIQIYNIAMKNKCEFFFAGYNGLKTANLKPENIPKALDFLLSESRVPTFILKDKLKRGEKNRGYKWLLILDRANSDCLKVLDFFLPFVDLNKDFIFGLTLLPHYVNFDDVNKQFYNKMEKLGFNHNMCDYDAVEYKSRPSEIVKEFVNHNTKHYFDFVLFYNNPDKYKVQRTESESIKYLMKINANIAFVNGVYLEKFEANVNEKEHKRNYKGEYEKFLENEKKEKEKKNNEDNENEEKIE